MNLGIGRPDRRTLVTGTLEFYKAEGQTVGEYENNRFKSCRGRLLDSQLDNIASSIAICIGLA